MSWTPGLKALSDAQSLLGPMLVQQQSRLDDLALREATAKAEAAEWAAKREELIYWATYGECKRLGWTPPALASVVCLQKPTTSPQDEPAPKP